MENRKCLNCGGTLKKGSYICEYCGSDWSPVKPIGPGSTIPTVTPPPGASKLQPPRPSPFRPPQPPQGARPWHLLLFLFLLFFCGPLALIYMWVGIPWSRKIKWFLTILFFIFPMAVILIFGLFSETLYAIRMDAPQFSTHPPPVQERPLSGLSADQVYKDMRDTPDRSLDQRKSEWRRNYEGKWVEWEGTITYLSIYDSSSSLKLKTSPDLPFEVEVNFDPLLNPSLQELSEGDPVKVSGMLWGYYFLMDEIRLADGAIIDAKQPEPPPSDSES